MKCLPFDDNDDDDDDAVVNGMILVRHTSEWETMIKMLKVCWRCHKQVT